jgi:hypothetical protein
VGGSSADSGTPTGGGGFGGPTGGGGSGGPDGGTPTGGAAGTGGNLPDATPDVDFPYDAPVHDTNLAEACVDQTAEAKPVPLDIYFMLDASTSMSEPVGDANKGDCDATPPFTPAKASKWCKAINAVAGYISSPNAAGNRAAIQYFRHYTSHNCNGSGYDQPSVALGVLPGNFSGHATTIVQADGGLNWAYPHSNTPTEGALRGLARFTAASRTPDRVIIGILVTDGEPTFCNRSDGVLADIPAQHFAATGIHTFVVGMTGANFVRLEKWASYAGSLTHDDTNDACGTCNSCTCQHYNVGDGNPSVFIAALNQIQKSVLSCTFQVPKPNQGLLDPDLVRVEYYAGGQPPPVELPRVASGPCDGEGWYYGYDANNNPTTINLCSKSCETVQADSSAQVKIRIACQGS